MAKKNLIQDKTRSLAVLEMTRYNVYEDCVTSTEGGNLEASSHATLEMTEMELLSWIWITEGAVSAQSSH